MPVKINVRIPTEIDTELEIAVANRWANTKQAAVIQALRCWLDEQRKSVALHKLGNFPLTTNYQSDTIEHEAIELLSWIFRHGGDTHRLVIMAALQGWADSLGGNLQNERKTDLTTAELFDALVRKASRAHQNEEVRRRTMAELRKLQAGLEGNPGSPDLNGEGTGKGRT
jgi:hypothetical protein